MRMFIGTLFAEARNWKQFACPINTRLNGNLYILAYYTKMKNNKMLLYVTTMNLIAIVLN